MTLIKSFENSDALEISNGIIFDFYLQCYCPTLCKFSKVQNVK